MIRIISLKIGSEVVVKGAKGYTVATITAKRMTKDGTWEYLLDNLTWVHESDLG